MQTATGRRVGAVGALILAMAGFVYAQGNITAPKIGSYTVGDDYFLANYTQLLEYWNKVAKEPVGSFSVFTHRTTARS